MGGGRGGGLVGLGPHLAAGQHGGLVDFRPGGHHGWLVVLQRGGAGDDHRGAGGGHQSAHDGGQRLRGQLADRHPGGVPGYGGLRRTAGVAGPGQSHAQTHFCGRERD